MPSDQNPWNLGGNGARKPPSGSGGGDDKGGGGGPNWGGNPWGGGPKSGGPGGRVPPDVERVLTLVRGWLKGPPNGSGGSGGGSGGGGFPGSRGLIAGGVAVAAIWLATGFYRVQPDEQGLVLRFGAFDRATAPGLNYHAPWPIESALLLSVTRINRVEIGFRSSAADEPDPAPRAPEGRSEPARGMPARDLAEESLMLTGDENIVDINASVFWRINDAAAFAFNARNPGYTVKSAAESMLRQVVGRTKIESALTEGRAAIEAAVTTGTQAILDQYKTGVEITQVQLQKVDPPEAVIESFRDVQRANTDADTARNDAQAYSNDVVPRARGDASVVMAQANGAKQAAISAATGEAQRFLSVLAAYAQAKDVTLKRLYIETMQDVLRHASTVVVDDKLRGLVPLLPLGAGGDLPPTASPDQGAAK